MTRKLPKWIKDNLVMIVGIPLIIGVHYGWAKIQDVPYLVDQSKKRELPTITIFRSMKDKVKEKLNLAGISTGESREK